METPQCDVSSPHTWVAFSVIACRTLELAATSQPGCEFQAWGPQHQKYPVGDIAFADDLQTTASALAGLQLKADIYLAFTVCFDLWISTDILRVAFFGARIPYHP